MKIRIAWACVAVSCLGLGTMALAAEFDIWSKTINNDTNGTWNIQPEKPKAKYIEAKGIPGDHAFRVRASKGINPWDVQASSPVAGDINQGDVIMLMYYARAEEAAEGGSKLTARVQLNAAPWTSVLEMTSPLTGEWKTHCAFGVATADLGKKGSVSIHLATAKQIIDLGPVFVFNFGKGFDDKNLKGCDL